MLVPWSFANRGKDNDDWETPPELLHLAAEKFNLDPAVHLLWEPAVHLLWERFSGTGRSTLALQEIGFDATNGDNRDFFKQSHQ